MAKAPTPTAAARPKGVPCPSCGCCLHVVTKTRHYEGLTRRRRVCENCGRRFTTSERVQGDAND